METLRIKGTINVISPIAHNGNEKSGSTVNFRRMTMVTADGELADLPYIEGNAIRGNIRRLIMQDFMERIGSPKLSSRIYHMFFAGGNLEAVSSGEGQLDLALRRQIAELIPPLSLWGTSFLNQALAGKIQVAKAYLVCKEMRHFAAHYGLVENNTFLQRSAEQFICETFQTRRDDHNVDAIDSENPIQMKIETENICAGSRLMHQFVLLDTNEVEKSCMRRAIELWQERGTIGGKAGMGNGQIEIQFSLDSLPPTKVYEEFLVTKKSEILALLASIEQSGTKAAPKKKSRKPKKTEEKEVAKEEEDVEPVKAQGLLAFGVDQDEPES